MFPNGGGNGSGNNDPLLPLGEVCRRLPSSRPGKKLSTATVYRWIRSGKLPGVKIGSCYFVRESDLEAFIVPVPVRQKRPRQPSAVQQARRLEEVRRGLEQMGLGGYV